MLLHFFCAQGDGISVGMVTDFTHINRFVIRPVHPFPSVQIISNNYGNLKNKAEKDYGEQALFLILSFLPDDGSMSSLQISKHDRGTTVTSKRPENQPSSNQEIKEES